MLCPGDGQDARILDRSLVHGVAWTAGVKWLSQVLSWATTLIVARLLTPDDYGLVAMAAVFIGLIEVINEFGMGAAIVKYRELTIKQIAQINGLCVLFGLAGWALACFAAYPLSLVFNTPALVAVVITLGVNFAVTSFRIVPLSLLQRDLQFRTTAMNDGSQAILLSFATVTFAVIGLQYWALVLGALLSGMLSTLFAYRRCPTPLAWPRRQDIREAVTFGSHMVGWRLCWYVSSNADFFIAGKVLGQRALGAYSMAMTIATIPMEKVTSLIMRVMPSILSAVQHDPIAIRRYVLSLTEGLALVTMPAAAGIVLVAGDFVRLALGDAWLPAILPLQILGISIVFRSIAPIIPSIAVMVGLSRVGMQAGIINAIVLPIAFLVGSRWGIGGIAAAWLIAYPFLTLPLYYVVFRRIGMGVGEYMQALWPAASSVVLMAAVVYGVQQYLHPHWPLALRLTAGILLGALTYLVALLALHRTRILAFKDVYHLLRSK